MRFQAAAVLLVLTIAACRRDDEPPEVPHDAYGFRLPDCDNFSDDTKPESFSDAENEVLLRGRYPAPFPNTDPAAVDSISLAPPRITAGDYAPVYLEFTARQHLVCETFLVDSGKIISGNKDGVYPPGRHRIYASMSVPMADLRPGCHRLYYVFSSTYDMSSGNSPVFSKGHIDFEVR